MNKISIIFAFFSLMDITAYYSGRISTKSRPFNNIITHANYSGEVIIKS